MPTNISDAQLYDEYNKMSSFELCHLAQELVQEVISRTSELHLTLKTTAIYLLMGDQNLFLQRKMKAEEVINRFELLFQQLRVLGSIIHQRKITLDQQHEERANQMISDAEDSNIKNIENLKNEHKELEEQLRTKINLSS